MAPQAFNIIGNENCRTFSDGHISQSLLKTPSDETVKSLWAIIFTKWLFMLTHGFCV